ncbi:MAG: hypothetical protein JO091_12605, partial [Acidobacteriaceae bacterium]|nr:hypothetical protein [Acidobacteriaceae bacterium]
MNKLFPSIAVCLLSAVAGAQTKPPTAPVRPVTDDYFGTKLVDPYRWMENSKSAEFQTWLKQ